MTDLFENPELIPTEALSIFKYKWFYENGELKGELPQDCVDECSSGGDVTSLVEHWVEELGFEVPREAAIKYLEAFGAWDDLENASQDDLNGRCLWSACCDISEQGEWYGLIH